MKHEIPMDLLLSYTDNYELIWENDDPISDRNTNIGDINISVDLATYSVLYVVMVRPGGSSCYGVHALMNNPTLPYEYVVDNGDQDIGMHYRFVKITDSGLSFSHEYQLGVKNTSATYTSCLPYRIYGIR